MAGAGIIQSICLPLLSVYQLSSNGTGQVGASVPSPGGAVFPGSLLPQALVAFLPPVHCEEPRTYSVYGLAFWCPHPACSSSAQATVTSRKSLVDVPSWPGVYRLSMSLMERLLKTLRYNFLTEALDFLGVHQERTLQVGGL